MIGGRCRVTDLKSTNGTLVNGKQLGEDVWIDLDDVVEVGRTELRLVETAATEVTMEGDDGSDMSDATIACEECGTPVSWDDLAAGDARRVGDRNYCIKCSASFEIETFEEEESSEVEAIPVAERLEVGSNVAGVRIVSFVGEGTLGALYEAEQLSMGRLVALKVLNVADRTWAKKYLQAVYASGKLVHPNIALIFDAGEVDDTYYVVREYVEGESVGARLTSRGAFPLEKAFSVIIEVIHALEYAYERRMFHGALSPRKILLGKNDSVKLTGVGVLQTMPESGSPIRNSWHILPYTAPERLDDAGTVDFTADVYSLMAIFYHMLTGHAPFTGADRISIEKHIREKTPDPLSKHKPDLPETVQRIISRGLSKDPRARYQLPRELLYELEENLRKEL